MMAHQLTVLFSGMKDLLLPDLFTSRSKFTFLCLTNAYFDLLQPDNHSFSLSPSWKFLLRKMRKSLISPPPLGDALLGQNLWDEALKMKLFACLVFPLRNTACLCLLVMLLVADASVWSYNAFLIRDEFVPALMLGLSLTFAIGEVLVGALFLARAQKSLRSDSWSTTELEMSYFKAGLRKLCWLFLGWLSLVMVTYILILSQINGTGDVSEKLGQTGIVYNKISQCGISWFQLGLPLFPFAFALQLMRLLKRRAETAVGPMVSVNQYVSQRHEMAALLDSLSQLISPLVALYSIMAIVSCISVIGTQIFDPTITVDPGMSDLWDIVFACIHVPSVIFLLHEGGGLSNSFSRIASNFDKTHLKDESSVQELLPISNFLRNTSPRFRIYFLQITPAVAQSLFVAMAGVTLSLVRISGGGK